MKYQNLSPIWYIIQWAKLFVSEFQHIYARVLLLFIITFAFSGWWQKSPLEKLWEKNWEKMSQAFMSWFDEWWLIQWFKMIWKERKAQKAHTIWLFSWSTWSLSTWNLETWEKISWDTISNNSDISMSRIMWIAAISWFIFVLLSVFILIGWRIWSVWVWRLIHIIYRRINQQEVSQRESLMTILNQSLIVLKTDALCVWRSYRPSVGSLSIIMIVWWVWYVKWRSDIQIIIYLLVSWMVLLSSLIYWYYIWRLKYWFSKYLSFTRPNQHISDYLLQSDNLTKNRRRNLYWNNLLFGLVWGLISILLLLLKYWAIMQENWAIAIATCISTIATTILLLSYVVMFREFELSEE